jgi:hypothetical protein
LLKPVNILLLWQIYFQGLIQSVFELHDGSGVVVTVGKYVTPNHMDINGNGIEPDYQNFPGTGHHCLGSKMVISLNNLSKTPYAGWSDVKKHLSECNINRQG